MGLLSKHLTKLCKVAAPMLLVLGMPARAAANPAQLHLEADQVSAGINRALGSSGSESYVTVLAIRPEVGVPTLYVRICQDLTSPCDEYAHQLQPGEY